MMENFIPESIPKFIYPIVLFIACFIAGLLIEKYVLVRLKKFAAKTKWKADDIIVNSLKGMLIVLPILVGAYLALSISSIPAFYFNIIQKVLIVIFILLITVFIKRILDGIIINYFKKSDSGFSTPTILSNITKIAIYAVGILIILQFLGIPITPIITAFGVGGLAIALALQSTLSNLFSGLYILASKHVKPGDYVRLDSGEEGYVTDITWRNATIREIPGNIIVIPNSKLSETIVKNFSLPKQELRIIIDVGVSYDSDLEFVEKITLEVADETVKTSNYSVRDFKPLLRYYAFGDSSINFEVYLKSNEFINQFGLKHEFIKKLHNRYKEEGIEIPFPIRTVYMKK